MSNVTIVSSCERSRNHSIYNKDYETKAIRLVHSIRNSGSRYKDSDILMWYSPEAKPSDNTLEKLQNMGCSFIEGETVIPEDPVVNKIKAVTHPVKSEYVMWMDSDMYVLSGREFTRLIDLDVDLAATGSEYSFHRWARFSDNETWSKLYNLVGVDKSEYNFIAGLDGKPCNFYFNSALVKFRTGFSFPEVWLDTAIKVRYSGIAESEKNFTQTSLTLAALKTKCSWSQLPETYNSYYAIKKENSLESAIVHYQDNNIGHDCRIRWDV